MKIVVRGANWIGDAVMTLPALRRLRSIYPEAHIALHTREWAEGVFRDLDVINEILAIPRSAGKLESVRSQARQLRPHKFDLAVLFPNSFESALVTRLSNIPKRLGYATQGRSFLLTDPLEVPEWKGSRHESEYYLNLCGTPRSPLDQIKLVVSEERKIDAKRLLSEYGVETTKPVIAFGAGSTNSRAKRWPAENFAKLSDMIAAETGSAPVFMGSQDEADVTRKIVQTAEHSFVDLCGKTDLATATAILSVADLFISNDMGLAHIAAATGTPTIVIFGPTKDETTRPLGPHIEIIRENVDCSPCMLRDCPIDHRCMTRIGPERVLESALKMLELQSR
jgi:heptosyltransferase-2